LLASDVCRFREVPPEKCKVPNRASLRDLPFPVSAARINSVSAFRDYASEFVFVDLPGVERGDMLREKRDRCMFSFVLFFGFHWFWFFVNGSKTARKTHENRLYRVFIDLVGETAIDFSSAVFVGISRRP
jgi:hypothetical protein